jgi:acetyl-CoA carboxylase biotin carboxyl carrier protein
VDLREIKELIELVAEKRLAEFELEKGGFKMRIRHYVNAPATAVQPSPSPVMMPALNSPVALSAPAVTELPQPVVAPAQPAAEPKAEKELHKIKAPIVGTFYRAPSPTSESFVKTGSRVAPGTVLCIIEAMKLMNEIEADVAGEVAEIYVENGQPVEYGQPLFGIKTE